MLYKNKTFTISYEVYGNKNNQSVLLLPQGTGFSSSVKRLAQALSETCYVISPDMPGVGESMSKNADLKNIAENFKIFMEDLGINKPIVFGYSYGGSMAIYLTKIMAVKALILVGTGNYFRYWQKILLSLIFVPTILFGIFRKLYAQVLNRYLHWRFYGFSDRQLKIINKRWYRSIWYNLPKYKSNIPALLINSPNDRICSKDSGAKLKEIYPNGKTILYSCGHYDYLNELETKSFADIKQFLFEME